MARPRHQHRTRPPEKIPHVVGIAAGAERAAAVAAALKGGMVKSLLIDESGAQALLAG